MALFCMPKTQLCAVWTGLLINDMQTSSNGFPDLAAPPCIKLQWVLTQRLKPRVVLGFVLMHSGFHELQLFWFPVISEVGSPGEVKCNCSIFVIDLPRLQFFFSGDYETFMTSSGHQSLQNVRFGILILMTYGQAIFVILLSFHQKTVRKHWHDHDSEITDGLYASNPRFLYIGPLSIT